MMNVRTATITFVIVVIIIAANSHAAEEDFTLLAIMSGDSVGDEFCVVANVGDINGDGYPDVLVGAPGGEYAKLYFGGASFDTIPDLIFTDEKEHTRFGCSVAGDGDVNGDGYPDIVIGASSTWVGPSYPDRSVTGAGAAYVYFGGPGMDTIPNLELVVANWDEQVGWYYGFGLPVVIAGDINGDSYDDIVIGASHDDYDAHGRVYIYFGGSDMDTEYDVLLEGEDHHDNLGYSIAGARDINHDGYDDILIGAPQSFMKPGKAYLVYGGDEIMFSDATVFIGDSAMHYFGTVVSGLGDVNGDDYPDIGVMALDYISIFLGSTDIGLVPDIKLFPHIDFWYINGLGDLNKDGYDDIGVVSKYFEIFLGKTIIDTIPDISFELWYSPICGLGDINCDSYIDIGLGRSGGWDPIGKVYIYSYGMLDKIKEGSSLPKDFCLYQNHPNPFNFATKITYYLPTSCNPRLTVYDITGREIALLIDKYQTKGKYSICWNTVNYSSGVYFVQMTAGNSFTITRKLLLIK